MSLSWSLSLHFPIPGIRFALSHLTTFAKHILRVPCIPFPCPSFSVFDLPFPSCATQSVGGVLDAILCFFHTHTHVLRVSLGSDDQVSRLESPSALCPLPSFPIHDCRIWRSGLHMQCQSMHKRSRVRHEYPLVPTY